MEHHLLHLNAIKDTECWFVVWLTPIVWSRTLFCNKDHTIGDGNTKKQHSVRNLRQLVVVVIECVCCVLVGGY